MIRKFAAPLLTALIAVLAVSTATSQVSRVPNSGCAGAPFAQPVGNPAIGQGFGVIAPQCRTAAGQQFILIGAPQRPVVLPVPPACVRGCTLDVDAFTGVSGGAWRTLIPNRPALVGLCFRVQTGCIERGPNGPCINMHGAIDVCITR